MSPRGGGFYCIFIFIPNPACQGLSYERDDRMLGGERKRPIHSSHSRPKPHLTWLLLGICLGAMAARPLVVKSRKRGYNGKSALLGGDVGGVVTGAKPVWASGAHPCHHDPCDPGSQGLRFVRWVPILTTLVAYQNHPTRSTSRVNADLLAL